MRPLVALGLASSDSALGGLIKAGVVRGVDSRGRPTVLGDGLDRVASYYLDEPAYVAHRDTKTRADCKLAIPLVVAFVLLLVGVALLVQVTRS